jgi:hypothetical protein
LKAGVSQHQLNDADVDAVCEQTTCTLVTHVVPATWIPSSPWDGVRVYIHAHRDIRSEYSGRAVGVSARAVTGPLRKE